MMGWACWSKIISNVCDGFSRIKSDVRIHDVLVTFKFKPCAPSSTFTIGVQRGLTLFLKKKSAPQRHTGLPMTGVSISKFCSRLGRGGGRHGWCIVTYIRGSSGGWGFIVYGSSPSPQSQNSSMLCLLNDLNSFDVLRQVGNQLDTIF